MKAIIAKTLLLRLKNDVKDSLKILEGGLKVDGELTELTEFVSVISPQ